MLEGEACKLGIKVSTATSAVHATSLLLLLLHLLLLLLLVYVSQSCDFSLKHLLLDCMIKNKKKDNGNDNQISKCKSKYN